MKSTVDFSKLKGRIVQVDRDGTRLGRVVSVKAGPRIGLRSIRLAASSYEGRTADGRNRWSWRGPQFRVEARQARGVLFRGRLIPIEEFVKASPRQEAREIGGLFA